MDTNRTKACVDQDVLAENAEIALQGGRELMSWWQRHVDSLQIFPLAIRGPNLLEAVAFYDTMEGEPSRRSIMGCMQKARFKFDEHASGREVIPLDQFVNTEFLSATHWTHPDRLPGGFTYEALCYKRIGSGEVGRFEDGHDRSALHLADIGKRLEWLVLQVNVHDFVRSIPSMRPFVRALSKLVKEAAYVVAHADYGSPVTSAPEGTVAESCFGYSFLPLAVTPTIFGFGPGQFRAAIKQFRFLLLDRAEVEIQLAFIVSPRSQKILNLWGFDPVYTTIHGLHGLTFGSLGIKRKGHDKLDAVMLQLHAQIHHNLLTGMREMWQGRRWVANTGM